MNVHQAIEFVEESSKFKDFMSASADAYLVHGFCTFDKEPSPWQIGYFDPVSKMITAFTAGEVVTMLPEDEAFREEGDVPALKESDIKVSFDEALAKAEAVRVRDHRAEDVTKRIIIVQFIDGIPTWNITLITNVFTMLNVRVSALTGDELSVSANSILNLGTRT